MPMPPEPELSEAQHPTADPRVAEASGGDLIERMRATSGLPTLVAEAVSTWRARANQNQTGDDSVPGWRAFSDAFPSFWEFTNRPR